MTNLSNHKSSQAGVTLIELLTVLMIICILVLVGWRFWRRPLVTANEKAAAADLRAVHTGAVAYYVHGRFFPPATNCLAIMAPCGSQPPGCPCYPDGDPLIDPALAADNGAVISRFGYMRQWIPGAPIGPDRHSGFCYQALPEVVPDTGTRSFGIDANGVLGGADGQVACCGPDGRLNQIACPAVR